MKKETCIESVSHKRDGSDNIHDDVERMTRYKLLSVGLSYPDDNFLEVFPEMRPEMEELCIEYDSLFRAREIWLYSTEYADSNIFQKSKILSNIMGFYHAFGVEPQSDRPDSLSHELEFMHLLIYKTIHATQQNDTEEAREKASLCLDAQKKFFTEHLQKAATKIAEKIITHSEVGFYRENAMTMNDFIASEKEFLLGEMIL